MITNEDILNMNFYKKEKFTGSCRGMRYRIQKDTLPAGDTAAGGGSAGAEDVFLATIWPGPYCFDATPEEQKTSKTFPFTPEGKQQVVDWLNEQWSARSAEWPASL